MRARVIRGEILAAFVACCALLWPDQSAARKPDELGKFDVGHMTFHMSLIGAAGEARPVDVEVWYPAKKKGFGNAPLAVYRSRLHGVTLIPSKWDPLSWELVSTVAREGAPVDDKGRAFPVVVFSHGSGASPLDFIKTHEHLASHGYVVAAPWHTRANQDDNRVNFLNAQNGGPRFMPCPDGRLIPCIENVTQNVAINRTRDVSGVLDALPQVFGAHVDMDRVGVMGHSAGATTAILAAGGSTAWGIVADPRVDAVLPMAYAGFAEVNAANVTVPTLIMAGELDANTPPADGLRVYNEISSADKAYVLLRNAVHRTFNSSFCDQLQASGAATLANPTRGILDRHTLTNMIGTAVNGSVLDYCAYDYFTSPVDISALVSSLTGFAVTETSVPRTGVSSDEVAAIVNELAVLFFSATLEHKGEGKLVGHLDHKLMARHGPFIEHVESMWKAGCEEQDED
jgi:predicted dienelactone hydrolase